MQEIGDKLYALRAERKISQEQLGEMVGVTRQTVSLWEANKRQITAEKLKLICKVFDVAPEYFLSKNDSAGSLELLSDDVEVVACEDEKEESQFEVLDDKINPQVQKKKLLRKNIVLSLIIALAVIIGIATAIITRFLSFDDGWSFETSAVVLFNLGDLFWIIISIVIAEILVAAVILIIVNIKHKKIK